MAQRYDLFNWCHIVFADLTLKYPTTVPDRQDVSKRSDHAVGEDPDILKSCLQILQNRVLVSGSPTQYSVLLLSGAGFKLHKESAVRAVCPCWMSVLDVAHVCECMRPCWMWRMCVCVRYGGADGTCVVGARC